MIKGRDVIGLPVVNLKNGKEVGAVQDIVFIPESNYLQGLIIKGGAARGERVVLIEDVVNIGEDAIMIPDDTVLRKTGQEEGEERLVNNKGKIMGKKVLTAEGKELGKINDILLDPAGKRFEGYEVSEGLIDDLLKGRGILKNNYRWKIGEDAIIIETEKEEG